MRRRAETAGGFAPSDDLAARIAATPAGGTVTLGAGEHRVNLILERPITLRGRGERTHLMALRGTGPAIHVRSPGVVLEHFTLEHLDPDGVALAGDAATAPVWTTVTVLHGKVVWSRTAATTTRPASRALPEARLLAVVGAMIVAGLAMWRLLPDTSATAGDTGGDPAHVAPPREDASGGDPAIRDDDTTVPPPAPTGPLPPPSRVELVGWSAGNRDAVVDTFYGDGSGASMRVRAVFDPRNGVVARLSGPGPRELYAIEEDGTVTDPVLRAYWDGARPGRHYTVETEASAPSAQSPLHGMHVEVDARSSETTGLTPADVALTARGFRITWRRRHDGTSDATGRGVTAHAACDAVTFNLVADEGAVHDVLQLRSVDLRAPRGEPPYDTVYQDIEIHWSWRRIVFIVNESSDDTTRTHGAYYLRSIGPQIKILHPAGDPERGHTLADRLEQGGLVATTVESNTSVCPGVYYRRHRELDQDDAIASDAGNPAVASEIQDLTGLARMEIEDLSWFDVLVVTEPAPAGCDDTRAPTAPVPKPGACTVSME